MVAHHRMDLNMDQAPLEAGMYIAGEAEVAMERRETNLATLYHPLAHLGQEVPIQEVSEVVEVPEWAQEEHMVEGAPLGTALDQVEACREVEVAWDLDSEPEQRLVP